MTAGRAERLTPSDRERVRLTDVTAATILYLSDSHQLGMQLTSGTGVVRTNQELEPAIPSDAENTLEERLMRIEDKLDALMRERQQR